MQISAVSKRTRLSWGAILLIGKTWAGQAAECVVMVIDLSSCFRLSNVSSLRPCMLHKNPICTYLSSGNQRGIFAYLRRSASVRILNAPEA